MTEEIILVRDDHNIPWGFRLTGGRDFNSPLTVVRVSWILVENFYTVFVGEKKILYVNFEFTDNWTKYSGKQRVEGGRYYYRN